MTQKFHFQTYSENRDTDSCTLIFVSILQNIHNTKGILEYLWNFTQPQKGMKIQNMLQHENIMLSERSQS